MRIEIEVKFIRSYAPRLKTVVSKFLARIDEQCPKEIRIYLEMENGGFDFLVDSKQKKEKADQKKTTREKNSQLKEWIGGTLMQTLRSE